MNPDIYQAPQWLYKAAALTDLDDFKTELLNYLIVKNNHKDIDRLHSLFYSYFNVTEFLTQCPAVKQKLDELGFSYNEEGFYSYKFGSC
jgi:hypothetical protein